jgi:hypothetical protein
MGVWGGVPRNEFDTELGRSFAMARAGKFGSNSLLRQAMGDLLFNLPHDDALSQLYHAFILNIY